MARASSEVSAWAGTPADLVDLARTMEDQFRDVRERVEADLRRSRDEAARDSRRLERADSALAEVDDRFGAELWVKHERFEHEESGPVRDLVERVDWSDVTRLRLTVSAREYPDERCEVRMSRPLGGSVEVFSGSDPDWVGRTHTTIAAHCRRGRPGWSRLHGQLWLPTLMLLVGSVAFTLIPGSLSWGRLGIAGVVVSPIVIASYLLSRRYVFPGMEVVEKGRATRARRNLKLAGWALATIALGVAASWVADVLGLSAG